MTQREAIRGDNWTAKWASYLDHDVWSVQFDNGPTAYQLVKFRPPHADQDQYPYRWHVYRLSTVPIPLASREFGEIEEVLPHIIEDIRRHEVHITLLLWADDG